jgi:competence ComEA-like helix-hairpin-helix protein
MAELSARGRLALVALVGCMAVVALAREELEAVLPAEAHAGQVTAAPSVAPATKRAGAAAPQRPHEHGAARVTAADASGEGDALRDGGRLDPNRASAAEWELLPGVGPSLARRLVEARTRDGPFHAPGDLLRVKGVGEKTLAKFAPLLRFESKQLEHPAQAQLGLGRAGHVVGLEQRTDAEVQAQGQAPAPEVVQAEQTVGRGTDGQSALGLVQPQAGAKSHERNDP